MLNAFVHLSYFQGYRATRVIKTGSAFIILGYFIVIVAAKNCLKTLYVVAKFCLQTFIYKLCYCCLTTYDAFLQVIETCVCFWIVLNCQITVLTYVHNLVQNMENFADATSISNANISNEIRHMLIRCIYTQRSGLYIYI